MFFPYVKDLLPSLLWDCWSNQPVDTCSCSGTAILQPGSAHTSKHVSSSIVYWLKANAMSSHCNQTSAGSLLKFPNLQTKDVILCCLLRTVAHLRRWWQMCTKQWWKHDLECEIEETLREKPPSGISSTSNVI
jgi:hypothetical protein